MVIKGGRVKEVRQRHFARGVGGAALTLSLWVCRGSGFDKLSLSAKTRSIGRFPPEAAACRQTEVELCPSQGGTLPKNHATHPILPAFAASQHQLCRGKA
jgi:hypothetical protein